MFNLSKMGTLPYDKDKIAKMLQADPSLLDEFEKAYKKSAIEEENNTRDDPFAVNAKQASEMMKELHREEVSEEADKIVAKVVEELVAQTDVLRVRDGHIYFQKALPYAGNELTNEDLSILPQSIRPQLTGSLMKVDIDQMSYQALLFFLLEMEREKNSKKKTMLYHMFRQGLDILDLDPVVYRMLGMNRNNMGYWLPRIVESVYNGGFFKIPDTTIIKVPMTMLQLTRCDYGMLTKTTLKIVDEFCHRVFELDDKKEYFIKTGTYSSKYDFRNAHVHGEKEVKELGEYLLYIHYQALMMASPLSTPSIYGVSTTNEWVVRDFIQDKENNPSIYKGLPLHTEYRVFVDFDTDEVIGYSPYWEPEMLKRRFGSGNDKDSVHMIHDYTIIKSYEDTLTKRYDENIDKVVSEIQKILPFVDMEGQWSIDIMQNGDDFWLIDMALAENSALNECVPKEKLKHYEENWLPQLGPEQESF